MKMQTLLTTAIGLMLTIESNAQDVSPPEGFRANQSTYSPIMDVLADSRNVEVSDAQLDGLRQLQIEAIWDGLGDYQANYVTGFISTQPGKQLVGRALTMRFLPARPDVRDALLTLAEEGDWAQHSYSRVAEDARPGDVVVADLGGISGDQMFGDVGGLGIMLAGVKGAVIDGGNRDLEELREPRFSDFPVYSRYSDIDTSKWLPAEWNIPVRIGNVTVLPGDIVVATDAAALFFPPQMVEQVLEKARGKVALEDFQRELLHSKKFRFRDVYPKLSTELEELYRKESGQDGKMEH